MKTRKGYISNSSSSSFIIFNDSKKPKRLLDLINENEEIVKKFVNYHMTHNSYKIMSYDSVIKDIKTNYNTRIVKKGTKLEYSNESCDFFSDLMLDLLHGKRESENFHWFTD